MYKNFQSPQQFCNYVGTRVPLPQTEFLIWLHFAIALKRSKFLLRAASFYPMEAFHSKCILECLNPAEKITCGSLTRPVYLMMTWNVNAGTSSVMTNLLQSIRAT